jgi:hypothetical protein
MASANDDKNAIALPASALPSTREGQHGIPAASPTQAETALNAILDLLERNKSNKKSHQSQISASQDGPFDSTIYVDQNLRLLSELQAIVENYHLGKDHIPRSGVAEDDIELPRYEGAESLAEIQRVGVALLFLCSTPC